MKNINFFLISLSCCVLVASSANDICKSHGKTLNFVCKSGCERFTFTLDIELLNYKNCQWSKLPTGVFKDFRSTNISTMNIASIGLEQLQMENFAGAKHLRKLIANHNKLKVLPDRLFTDTKIEFLDLAFNRITDVGTIGRSSASNLKTLILSNNNVAFLDETTFMNLTALITLDVSFNALVKLQTGVFDKLMHLEHLVLVETNLTHLDFGILSPLTKLKSLDISGNQMMMIDIGLHSPVFYHLEKLFLRSSGVIEIDGLSSTTFPQLIKLDLRENHLNCSHLVSILSSFDLNKLKLEIDPSPKVVRDKSFRGVACHPNGNKTILPIKSTTASPISSTTTEEPFETSESTETSFLFGTEPMFPMIESKIVSAPINDQASLQHMHESLKQTNSLMTVLMILIVVTIIGKMLYKHWRSVGERLQKSRIIRFRRSSSSGRDDETFI